MTRTEAEYLYGWLENSYPRNYRDADLRRKATTIDNLAKVFAHDTYKSVQEAYERIYAAQKNEPHPSEVKANLRGEREQVKAEAKADPYEVLQKHQKWFEMCEAYGERACRRAAKLCTQTATVGELMFHLEHDIPCREDKYN